MSAAANAVGYDVPNGDFCAYLKGLWKRNLEWRRFGASFKHLRSTNNIVFIEEDLDAARQPNTQFLRWSFGRTLKQQDLASAYTVQFIPDEQGTFMEWSFEGVTCHGVFKPEANVAILNFCLQESMVTITYRVLDANTMAVCIVDVDSEHTPTIQYGNMRVAIGGTFACDEALAVPLQYLLKNAVWNVDVDLQWLRYGSVTDFEEWSSDVVNPARPVDLVLLLVRLSDLEAAHPELQLSKKSDDVVDGPINQFWAVWSNTILWLLLRWWYCCQYTTAFYDAIADKRQHSPYTQAMLNVMSLSLCRQICRLFRAASRRKKVIVLDCDNTLWGGAVAEVGPSGIDLGPRFLSLQRFVVAQQQRGMLLALCSKNILEDVTAAFTQRRDDMVLDLDKHVVATKVNWQPKSENIAQLAKELSLGLDSFIFIDDNPLECNEVATALPSITVIPLGADFSGSLLDHVWVFDDSLRPNSSRFTATINTQEDSQRTQHYQQNLQREQLRESSSTHKAFLSALGVKIVFEELNRDQELQERSFSCTRALQLHHRTNQFNTATTFAKRLEEEALLEYIAAPEHTVICAHVTDRFGHYGLLSAQLSCFEPRSGTCYDAKTERSSSKNRCDIDGVCLGATERNQPAHAFFSTLSDVAFAAKNGHHTKVTGEEKQQLSSSKTGTWVIATGKGSQVTFLKAEDTRQLSIKAGNLIGWLLHLRSSRWLRDLALSGVRWMLSSIPLPHWLARLFKSSLVQRLGDVESVGLLRVPLRDPGSLEQFVTPALHDVSSANNVVVPDSDNDDSNSDDKFRRKARHQTKMALVDHLHGEAPSVICALQRSSVKVDVPFSDAAIAATGFSGS
ncbi:HAD-like domain [Phytophthora cactorum]|nr:HAD-like domain [Phytophthora cactorum]